MIETIIVYLRKGRIYIHSRQINKHEKTDPTDW